MTKKYIGSSDVKNGLAEGEFTLPENLPKGVYQLIAEYSGSSIYKSSYDIKQLIVAWLSQISLASYTISENTRILECKATLVGYDDSNTKQYLAYRNIIFRIGTWNPNDSRSIYQQYKDATVLTPYNSTVSEVSTGEYGEAKAKFVIPTTFSGEHYYLYAYFAGDTDYINAVARNDLIIGARSTSIVLTCRPSNNINGNGGTCIVEARVYLNDDMVSGYAKSNADPITEGKIVFKHGTSRDISTHTTVDSSDEYVRLMSSSLSEDGYVSFLYLFEDISRQTRFVSAKYSGVTDKYRSSQTTTPLEITIDQNGSYGYAIRTDCSTLVEDTNTLYVEENVKTCHTFFLTLTSGANAGSGTLEAVTFKPIEDVTTDGD